MEFYRNFLIEYVLIGIVKLKFIRRNELWCRILKKENLSINVRNTQDRTIRNNLVFSGIPESRGEVCEDTLRDFLKNK